MELNVMTIGYLALSYLLGMATVFWLQNRQIKKEQKEKEAKK